MSISAINRPENTMAKPIFDLIFASNPKAKKIRAFAKSNNSIIMSIPHNK